MKSFVSPLLEEEILQEAGVQTANNKLKGISK